MGTSNWHQIPFCIEAMLHICPTRVLDVGIGFGRWGLLLREFCEEWQGRMSRDSWQVHLEGIEAFPQNVQDYHHLFYDRIHLGDGLDIIGGMTERWNLIIFGDVLEHWVKDQARQVLEKGLDLADYVLVNIPLGPGWERSEIYGNPYEEHKSFWELAEFLSLHPVRSALFREDTGRDYGAFLLSRTDTRALGK